MDWLDGVRTHRRLPTFVVIGAMKCGTTSLHKYLDTHPDIGMSRLKEPNFFISERNCDKGLRWYAKQFDRRARARGESSPNYSKRQLFEGVPRRMQAVLPDAKLVYLVRDPIERALSHAEHSVRKGRLPPEALGRIFDPPPGLRPRDPEYSFHAPDRNFYYLHTSRYHYQLTAFLEHYPLSQILVVATEELLDDRRATLRRIFSFLGVDADYTSPSFDLLHHESHRQRDVTGDHALERPALTPGQRDRMVEVLKPDVDRLRKLTGQLFPAWSL